MVNVKKVSVEDCASEVFTPVIGRGSRYKRLSWVFSSFSLASSARGHKIRGRREGEVVKCTRATYPVAMPHSYPISRVPVGVDWSEMTGGRSQSPAALEAKLPTSFPQSR